MATRWAVQNGNWSSASTWNGGTLPTSSDDVYADGYTVTIDQNVTVRTLQTNQRSGGTVGGAFNPSGTRSITATSGFSFRSSGMTVSADTTTLIGAVSGSAIGGSGILVTGGTLVINGNVTGAAGGSAAQAAGITVSNIGNLTVVGSVTGGTGTSTWGVVAAGTGTINITGDVIGFADGNGPGLYITGACTVNITGNLIPASSGSGKVALSCVAAATVTIVGTLTANSYGSCVSSSNGTFDITGTLTAVNGNPSVVATTNNITNLITVSGPLVSSSTGATLAVVAYRMRVKANQANSYIEWRDSSSANGVAVRWSSSDVTSGAPSAANVRLGTTFGLLNEFTGTLAVPPANAVASGVPVDNTTGTAALRPSDIAGLVGAQIAAALST